MEFYRYRQNKNKIKSMCDRIECGTAVIMAIAIVNCMQSMWNALDIQPSATNIFLLFFDKDV